MEHQQSKYYIYVINNCERERYVAGTILIAEVFEAIHRQKVMLHLKKDPSVQTNRHTVTLI